MPLPSKISPPPVPRFLPAPDHENEEMYILCTSPYALIWVRQTTPAQLWIVKGEQSKEVIRAAADWWREFNANQQPRN